MVKYKASGKGPDFFQTIKVLEEELTGKEKRLSEILSLEQLKKREIESLNQQIQFRSKSPPTKVKVYCAGCSNWHVFSYAPGKYTMCYTRETLPIDDRAMDPNDLAIVGKYKSMVPHYELVIDNSLGMSMHVSSEKFNKIFWQLNA